MIDESLMHRAVTALETHAIALNRQADALEKVVEIVAAMQKDLDAIASCVGSPGVANDDGNFSTDSYFHASTPKG